jgi:hypothetical protein
MFPQPRRFGVVLLFPLLLLTACGRPSPLQRTTWLLDYRLETQLAPDIAAGDVMLQPLPDGARVTLLGPAQFPNGRQRIAGDGYDVRASVIEGMLDPSLMRVAVADTTGLPENQREARVRNVRQYFETSGLGSVLQPAEPLQAVAPGSAGLVPAGLTLTISLQCPLRHRPAGYGSGQADPACD